MNINNGGLGFIQTLDNAPFQKALKQSFDSVNNFSAKSVMSMDAVQVKMNDLIGLSAGFLSVQGAKNFIQEMVKVRGEFEQLEIAFTTMLGSKEKADKLMMEIVDFAATTPFGLQSTSEATKMLLAYGESANTALDTIRKLGDIASGVGIPLKDMAYLYGTTMTQGRLYTQDLNQFLGRGIPMMDELAKIFGVNKNEVKALVEAGKVGFPEVQKAIDNLTASGSMFGGLMEAQSKSISGQIEQLKDAIDVMFNEIGKSAQPIVSDVISGAAAMVENYEKVGASITALIATYGSYKAAVITMNLANSSFLSSLDKIERYGDVGAKRLVISYKQAQATLSEVKAQEALSVQKLKDARLSKEMADSASKNAMKELNNSHALKKAADQEVISAQKKYEAYKGGHWIQKERQALQELEIAKTNQLAASNQVQTASVNYNTTAEKANTANKNLSIAATDRQTAKKAVAAATTNLETAATNRLTIAQRLNVAWTELATIATNAWNASLLSNPIVLIVAAIGGLTTAYFLLRDTTTEAEKAQEAYNKTQEKVKTGIEETKKKAEEYINVLKDETATVYQQIQAYKALQELRIKGLDGLSQEQIKLMEVNELKKLINSTSDDNNLKAQKSELKRLEEEIQVKEKRLQSLRQGSSKDQYEANKLADTLKVLTSQYNLQYNTVSKMENEMKMANMTLEQKKSYWENIVSSTQNQLNKINEVKNQQSETKTILGVNLGLVNETGAAFQMWNVNPLVAQLEQAKLELIQINQTTSKPSEVTKNKSFWEQQKKEASDARDALAYTQKGSKEWNDLTQKINEANAALQAYNDSYKKPSKTKVVKTKKADDPVEIYKKEISQIKEQYENYNKWVDTNDRFLLTQAHALGATLKFKGETYLDFLRKQAEELRKSATHSETARKQLYFINQELQQQIDFSEIEEYKKGIEKQIDSAKSLLEVTELIQMAKAGLEGKTDQSSVDKMEFLDSKDLDTAEKLKDAIQSVIDNNRSEMQEMNAMFDEYYRDLQYLNQALTEAFKIEDKERIESLQTAIEERTKKFSKATEGMTGDADYTELIKNHQSYADKIAKIEEKMRKDIETAQSNNDYSIIPQIEKQAKDETSKILKEQLMGSEEWANLFADMDELTVQQLTRLIDQVESQFERLKGKFNPIDLRAIQKQLNDARNLVIEKNPFGELARGLSDLFKSAKTNTNKDSGDIITKWNRVSNSLTGTFEFINDAVESTSVLKDMMGETASTTLGTVNTLVGLGTTVLAVSQMTTEGIKGVERASVILAIISAVIQIATKIANLLTNIFSKDKKRQKEINKHQEAVDALTDSYKDLENAVKSALGSDVYSGQKQMIDNLIKQQAEYQKMINAEKSKKKSDSGKIKEWEDAMRDAKQTIDDLLKEIADDVLQTTAKDLADELGDALVSAFSQGEDAAKSFEKVVDDILKNAVLNQLKKQFLEKQLQQALDQLYRDMGGDDQGNFNWNGLTPEEQQAFRDKMREISENFTGMLGAYSDLFQDFVDPNETALAGAIKGVSEDTANALLGQMNAIRILQVESIDLKRNSNAILVQQLDQLFRIEYNTRMLAPLLREIKSAIEDSDDSARAWGH